MRKPAFWLAVAFIFTVPWEAAIKIESIGRGSRALGLIAALVWAISIVLRGRIRRWDAFVWAYLTFLLWNGLTLFWSIDTAATLEGFLTYTQIFGMILILWDLLETEWQVNTALQAYVLGAYVSAVSIIWTWFTASTTRFPQYQRFKALGFEVDGIALIVALAIPVAWYLATKPSEPPLSVRMHAINFAYVPLAIFALTLTGTRGAALASVPTALFILWTLRRASPVRKFAAWIAVVLGIIAVLWLAPPAMIERITGSAEDIVSGDSLSGRRDIWSESIRNFLDNSFAGVGLDAHRASSSFGKEAHNTALSVLVETGTIGFMLFGGVVLAAAIRALQMTGWKAWFWRTQLAVVALGSMSLSIENMKSGWIFATLAVASAAAASARGHESDSWTPHSDWGPTLSIPDRGETGTL